MAKITFTELRQHAKAYFDAVEKGETFQVTRHGKVVAELSPPTKSFRSPSWKKPIPRLAFPKKTIQEMIEEERGERL